MALLDATQIAEVEAAIEAVESKTAGELVVAIVSRSDSYDLPRGACAGLAALFVMGVAHLLDPSLGADFLLLGQMPLWLVFWRLLGRDALLRRLSSGLHSDHIVRRRAIQLFAAHGLYRTRDQSGLLIMISELEHRVVILGDIGIHTHIGDSGWQNHVATITGGIKQGRAGQAIIATLEALGLVLAEHFPQRPDDTNELSNRIIFE